MLYTKETLRDTAMELYKRQNSRSLSPKAMKFYSRRQNRLDGDAPCRDAKTEKSSSAAHQVRSRSLSPKAVTPRRRQNGPALSVRSPPPQPVLISAATDLYQRRNAPVSTQTYTEQRQQEHHAAVSSPVRVPPVVLCDPPNTTAPPPVVVSFRKNILLAVANNKAMPMVPSTTMPLPEVPAAMVPCGGQHRQILRNVPPKLSLLCP